LGNVFKQLQAGSLVHRGFLGARIGYEVTAFDLEGWQLARVQIDDILAGSPAEAAGLQPGDIVVAAGNHQIGTISQFAFKKLNSMPRRQTGHNSAERRQKSVANRCPGGT